MNMSAFSDADANIMCAAGGRTGPPVHVWGKPAAVAFTDARATTLSPAGRRAYSALSACRASTQIGQGGHMTFRTFAAALGLSLLAAGPALAQQTPPPYGAPITLEMAKKVMAGAEAEAARNNWAVFVVIVDSGGNVVMLQRMDNAQLGSLVLAEGKARTALSFKLPTKALEDAISAGGSGWRLAPLQNITPLEGGLPIVSDGKIIGAVGVSGVLSAQDAQIARAGIQALGR
jgi:uncharacterized protein GlcG (DUF336 family)